MTSTETTTAMIPARNRRQAMDWSLVLLSQGMECMIEHLEHNWVLVVETRDFDRAVEALSLYQRENRGRRWRQKLPWPEIKFHPGAILWCFTLVLFYWLSAVRLVGLETAGVVDSAAVQNGGAWWRLFTSILLHADLAHLLANATIGLLVFGLAMGRYGAGGALLASYLAGAGGNLAGVLLYPHPYYGLGASGMVMGGLGLLTVQSWSLRRQNSNGWRFISAGIFAGILLFVLLGLDPRSDVIAHLGGFVCGLIFGAVMAWIPQKTLFSSKTAVLTGTVLTGLVVATWLLALQRAALSP